MSVPEAASPAPPAPPAPPAAHVPLARVTRAGVQDNLHYGALAVVDDSGSALFDCGDPGTRGYIRSAAKPIQAIPVLISGAPEAFGLGDADVAIICGSHRGGEAQVAQVRSILAKAGLSEEQLQSGSGIEDNCSGKHSGKLSACKHLGYDLEGYLDPAHPHQKAILETIAQVCALEPDEIHIGVDGCGAPIHYIPVRSMALGYARLSRPEKHFDAPTAAAVKRITRAMAASPGGHTGEPEYVDALGGGGGGGGGEIRFISKSGGNGVYCAGVIGKGVGFAVKVADGSGVPLKPVFTEVMRRLGVLSDDEAAVFRDRFWPAVKNRRGTVVGEVEVLV